MVTANAPWTIQALGNAVEQALAEIDYEGSENGQIRAVPNRRTIRYYTTLGLLDRPAAFEGRTAFYGPHHLRQLVAIKRLQASGLALVAVQEKMTGIKDGALKELAAVEDVLNRLTDDASQSVEAAPTIEKNDVDDASDLESTPRQRRDFWAAPAAALTLDEAAFDDDVDDESSVDESSADKEVPGEQATDGANTQFQGLSLGDDLIVLIKCAEAMSKDDEHAIREAAEPLLEVLKQRGLLPAHTKGNA